MTLVVLIFDCGHWGKGVQDLVGTAQICKRCPASARRVQVIGECSPYQVVEA